MDRLSFVCNIKNEQGKIYYYSVKNIEVKNRKLVSDHNSTAFAQLNYKGGILLHDTENLSDKP